MIDFKMSSILLFLILNSLHYLYNVFKEYFIFGLVSAKLLHLLLDMLDLLRVLQILSALFAN